MWHWLAHHLGMDNGGGGYYLWYSGFGANFGELVIIGAIWGAYRKHNCHVDGCWRLGKHAIQGSPYVVCPKHHPAVPDRVTHDHIKHAHAEAMK